MKTVIYGVNGEGMGHAIRSKPIIEHLSKKHRVIVVAGGRAFDYFKKDFETKKIMYMPLIYRNNSVNYIYTFLYNLVKFPFTWAYNLKIFYIMLRYKADLLICDFEFFSNYAAFILGKPCLCIDNQHIITRTKIEYPKKYWLDSLMTKLIIMPAIIRADEYLITNFFKEKIKKEDTRIFPPIIRDSIIKLKPKKGKHILVYQTSKSNKRLMDILLKTDEKFIFYGFNIEKKQKNIVFRRFNEDKFLDDLAWSKAVVTNGGATLITEALHLGKPILSVPVKNQFEQILNALYIEKLGYGKFVDDINKENLKTFLDNITKYEKRLKKYKRENNSKIIKAIEKEIMSF